MNNWFLQWKFGWGVGSQVPDRIILEKLLENINDIYLFIKGLKKHE